MTNTIKIRMGFRLPKNENKIYWTNLLQKFADNFNNLEVLEIQFGKQDMRGTESITLVDHRHCVPKQKHFNNKWEMLGYIQGFCDATDKTGYGHLTQFLKLK